jgi:hypothetical protein
MGLAARVLERFKKAGGTDFSVFVPGSDASKAFREAQDDASHEHGRGGYSGTIAEKNGYVLRRSAPMTREEAHHFSDKDIEQNDKWGPAFAVPISEAVKSTEKKFSVKVPASSEHAAREPADKAVREKFAPMLQSGVTPVITFEKVTQIKEGKLPEMTLEKGGPEGFKIVGLGGRVHRDGWDAGKVFPSRTEALSALKELIGQVKPPSGTKYQLIKFKTSDVFTIGDVTKSMHLFEVEGSVAFQKSTGKVIGYLFYGIASS